MSDFEKLVLRGLWLILRMTVMGAGRNSGTAEVVWAGEVAKAVGDDKLRNI